MTNLRGLSVKLQKALAQKGRKVLLMQTQIYSESTGRTLTKYTVKERNEQGEMECRLETWQLIDVVQFLAAAVKEEGDCEC